MQQHGIKARAKRRFKAIRPPEHTERGRDLASDLQMGLRWFFYVCLGGAVSVELVLDDLKKRYGDLRGFALKTRHLQINKLAL